MSKKLRAAPPVSLVLDSSVLITFVKGKGGIRKFVNEPRAERLHVPANAVAEWWRSGSKQQRELRQKIHVVPLTQDIAELAGQALAWLDERKRTKKQKQEADETPEKCETCGRLERVDDKVTIDATVMATAARIAGSGTSLLYTGDAEDMQRLADFDEFRKVQILPLPR